MDPGSIPSTPAPISVRVWHCEEGACHFVRMLSGQVYGLFVHWHRARSRLCLGVDCPPDRHKSDKVWNGYLPCEIWEEARQLWFPQVLQVSESLELDFRGQLEARQIWQIRRDVRKPNCSNPVCGALVESCEALNFPPCFDVKPVLQAVYHVNPLPPSVRNPMPQRIVLAPSGGSGPRALSEAPEMRKASPEDWARWRAHARGVKPLPNGSSH